MLNKYRIKQLKLRSRIYVGLLVFLSSLTFFGVSSCNEERKDSQQTADSTDVKIKNLEAELKAKNDSLSTLKKDMARLDSLDAIKNTVTRKPETKTNKTVQKPKYVPSVPVVDYGINPNFESPGDVIPKSPEN